ncbi:MAG TPA: PilN domain-containing protein [Terriglobales bacterium]|jgi:type IV pilus assembly protein PilN|nr:PilN domain-containing protein [Terriglobales bacterium]
MRVDINLASHPYEDSGPVWMRWGGGLAALCLITLVLLYSVFSGWAAARKDHNLMAQREKQIADRDREKIRAEETLNLPENRTTRDRSQFLNQLFLRKAFSWTKVFEDLERVMPTRLHVVSIQPAMAPDNQLEIKLVVAGESRDRALELVRKMEGSQHFQQTQIQQESNQRGQTPGDNVQFDISAVYVGEMANAGGKVAP